MEIEAKYTVPDPATFRALLALPALGEYVLRPAGDLDLTDRYLDTPERDLLRGGYACRVREGERPGRWLVTVKDIGRAEGAVHRREEHEVEIPAGAKPAEWPESPARELVTRLCGGRALGELLVLRQRRARRAVDRGGRGVAALSLDTVTIDAGGRDTVIREVEVELVPTGTLDDLRAIEALLRPYDVQAQSRSKFERALALLDGGAGRPGRKRRKAPGVRADEPLAEAGRKVLWFHFQRMLAAESGTRAWDIEALHDMRVAVRRQRAAFRIVAPCFKRRAVRGFRGGLRRLTRRLGAVRDLDVLIEAAEKHGGEALGPLLEEWRAQRALARDELSAFLDGDDYRGFLERWRAFLASPGAGAKRAPADDAPEPYLVRHVLPAEIWSHYAAVRAYEGVLAKAPLETIHAVRIEGKRLRYLLEFFGEALGPGVDEAVEALVAFQDHTGEIHDIDVTIALLRDHLERRPDDGVKGYLEINAARLRALRRALRRPWRRLTTKRFRRALARAVAEL